MFSIQAFLLFLYPKKIFPRPRLRRHFPVLFFREVSFCSRMDIQLNKHYLLKQFLSQKWHATCHKLSVYLCVGQFLGLLFSFLTSLLVLMLLYTILIILGLNMQQNNFCHLFFQDVLANLNPLYFHTDFTVRICPFPPTPLHLRNNNKRQPIGILMRNQYLYNIEFPNPQTGYISLHLFRLSLNTLSNLQFVCVCGFVHLLLDLYSLVLVCSVLL